MAGRDLVEELVHQFSDPFAFYRELIQNGLDAGSGRIEVTLRYHPAATSGRATAEVRDFGEGMNRKVIEDYLVTKFRSSKEGDLTKIGKFGIGFLSVFATQPELVVVDTGRDGEWWRVLFHPDRRYELLRLPTPVEGTKVTLHRRQSPDEYLAFVAQSRQAVSRWCRHSDADIVFAAGPADGGEPGPPTPVREPFAVDAPFQVEHREEGTHIVAGPSRHTPATFGMYNRGLTLLEGTEEHFPGVTFKIASRYLEHTLTRDNVRRDEGFAQAMKLVKALVEGPMRERLPAELRRAAEARGEPKDLTALLTLARGRLAPSELWFPAAAGGAVSGKDVLRAAKAAGGALVADKEDPLVAALAHRGVAVLWRDAEGRLERWAAELLGLRSVVPAEVAYRFVRPRGGEDASALVAALLPLVEACGFRGKSLCVGEVHGAGAQELAVGVGEVGEPFRVEREPTPFERGTPAAWCLNAAQAPVKDALRLAATHPRLAALLVGRLLLSRFGALDAARDHALTGLGLSR